MLAISEYEKQAEKFLTDRGLEFRAVLIGLDCPMHCKDQETDTDMDKLDAFPRKTHIHGKHYRCTLQRIGHSAGKEANGRCGSISFDYWNSYSDEERNWAIAHPVESRKFLCLHNFGNRRQSVFERHASTNPVEGRKLATVKAYDVFACMQKSDPDTFADFCADFGYDEDSRKAESIYRAVVKEWRKVHNFFTSEELSALQEIS